MTADWNTTIGVLAHVQVNDTRAAEASEEARGRMYFMRISKDLNVNTAFLIDKSLNTGVYV